MTIGNFAAAMMVKHFLKQGHKAVILVGGATGLIGDPDGKQEERNLKALDEIAHNKAAIMPSINRYLLDCHLRSSITMIGSKILTT